MKHRRGTAGAKAPAPVRTCIGCRTKREATSLLRLVRSPDGELLVDHPPRLGGRGAWVCPRPRCVRKALKGRSLSRTFGSQIVPCSQDSLVFQMRSRVTNRVEGLLAAAGRARKVVVGAQDAETAVRQGNATLVVLAFDVSKRVRRSIHDAAQASAVTVVDFGDRSQLGLTMARNEVGVLALTDAGFCAAVSRELELLRGLPVTEGQDESTAH